ncbi:MAG: hypothetical protein P4M11_02950 [Candidatus Pacebacteria bacterium]|nr:hypothetical protein [Candidatus Paceibacterota bacterium]
MTAACFNPEEDTLVTGHAEGTVKLWDANGGYALREQLAGFEPSKARVKQVLVTSDNTLYVSGSNGSCVRLNCCVGIVKLMRATI